MYMCRSRGERSIACVSCYMEGRSTRVAKGLHSTLEDEDPEGAKGLHSTLEDENPEGARGLHSALESGRR